MGAEYASKGQAFPILLRPGPFCSMLTFYNERDRLTVAGVGGWRGGEETLSADS